MSSELAIQVTNLSKCYHIYDQPRDRLKQFVYPRLQQLTKKPRKHYFREFWALSDVSFDVQHGETIGIVGRNGSGKSTLLQLICGTLTPTEGDVNVNGRVAALLELGAGFNAEFTGRENVLLNGSILGCSQEEILGKMDAILTFSELGDFIDQPVKTYSSGMFVRLAFATAIHMNPAILIVDEALSVGDARFQAKCMRRIQDLKAAGCCILFVSHDVASIRTLCDRVIWLDKGKMVEQGEVFPVTGRYMEFMLADNVAASAQNTVALPRQEQKTTLNARPVTHWGSDVGIILRAELVNSQGQRKEVFHWGEEINVCIEVKIPQKLSRDHLSIAFSIKDTKGSDIIVSTTHDMSEVSLPHADHFTISFRLVNWLVTGSYLLVAAVENRQHSDIHYYEYVEGAHYFSALSERRFFGIFHPTITQTVHVINDSAHDRQPHQFNALLG